MVPKAGSISLRNAMAKQFNLSTIWNLTPLPHDYSRRFPASFGFAMFSEPLSHFANGFAENYGTNHPEFFQGAAIHNFNYSCDISGFAESSIRRVEQYKETQCTAATVLDVHLAPQLWIVRNAAAAFARGRRPGPPTGP